MTTEQRFERIEAELEGVNATLRTVADIQERQTAVMSELTGKISHLTDAFIRQSEAADLRMTRVEESLEGLIRAITADHSNGKGKH